MKDPRSLQRRIDKTLQRQAQEVRSQAPERAANAPQSAATSGNNRTDNPAPVPSNALQPPPVIDQDSTAHISDVSDYLQNGGGSEKAVLNDLLHQIPDGEILIDRLRIEMRHSDIAKRYNAVDAQEWYNCELTKLDALKSRNVFGPLVPLPQGRKAIGCRWVYEIKELSGKKKARLVAQGFSQVEGIDYDEIFSPVVRYESVRLLLALAALENWHITFLDVRSAFLYGELSEDLYMIQPHGYQVKGKEQLVVKLNHAIYSLKQAALAWWLQLDKSMSKLGFTRIHSDAGVFVHRSDDGSIVIAMIYVDDSAWMGSSPVYVATKKAEFMGIWQSHDEGDLVNNG